MEKYDVSKLSREMANKICFPSTNLVTIVNAKDRFSLDLSSSSVPPFFLGLAVFKPARSF